MLRASAGPKVALPRYKLVCGRGQINGANTDSGGTNLTCNANWGLTPNMPFSFSNPRIIFTHWGVAGVTVDEYIASPAGTLTITASMTANSVTRQATFGGNVSVGLTPGGIAITDPMPIDVAANAAVSIRYYLSTGASNKWSRGMVVLSGLGDTVREAVADSDLTMGGTITNTQGADYGTSGVIGLTTTPQLAIAGLGDSIMYGQGDSTNGTDPISANAGNGNGFGYWGWLGRACYSSTIPLLNMSRAGDQASFNQSPYSYRKTLISTLPSGPIVDWVIVNLGTNDATNSRTYTQLKTDLTTIISDYHKRGVKVAICSITPKTTTTDSWATTVNQTFATGHTLSGGPALVNADLRAGTIYGADAFFDLASYVESSIGSGIWAASATADGLHPTQATHIAIAAGAQTFFTTLAPL